MEDLFSTAKNLFDDIEDESEDAAPAPDWTPPAVAPTPAARCAGCNSRDKAKWLQSLTFTIFWAMVTNPMT